jgi:hypothetical protein
MALRVFIAESSVSARGYQEPVIPLGDLTAADQPGDRAACFSLSHKPEVISHGEIACSASSMLPKSALVMSMQGSDPALANRLISEYGMSRHLYNRLVYAPRALIVNARYNDAGSTLRRPTPSGDRGRGRYLRSIYLDVKVTGS